MKPLDLQKLDVSLTKHGAYKIAKLLKKTKKGTTLPQLLLADPSINIDAVQASRNLSASENGEIPALWYEVQALGPEALNALVVVGLVFSHHSLIEAMSRSATRLFQGRLVRGKYLSGKAYTNFINALTMSIRYGISLTMVFMLVEQHASELVPNHHCRCVGIA